MKATKTKRGRSYNTIAKDMRKAWGEMIAAHIEATQVSSKETLENNEGSSCYRDQGSYMRIRDASGRYTDAQHRYGLLQQELVEKALGK